MCLIILFLNLIRCKIVVLFAVAWDCHALRDDPKSNFKEDYKHFISHEFVTVNIFSDDLFCKKPLFVAYFASKFIAV